MALTKNILDRVVQFPSRYKLTPVSGAADTFDFECAPGMITEEGTDIDRCLLMHIAETYIKKEVARFTTSGTWTVPEFCKEVDVFLCDGGQGGQGGGNHTTSRDSHGGTGGNTYFLRAMTVTPGDNIVVLVGAGTSGGAGAPGGATADGVLPPKGGRSEFGDSKKYIDLYPDIFVGKDPNPYMPEYKFGQTGGDCLKTGSSAGAGSLNYGTVGGGSAGADFQPGENAINGGGGGAGCATKNTGGVVYPAAKGGNAAGYGNGGGAGGRGGGNGNYASSQLPSGGNGTNGVVIIYA